MRKQSDSETLEQLYDLYEQKMYAVAVISLIPASAYAADKWIRMQNSNTGSYGSNLLLTKESTGNEEFTPVKLTATYLPDGSTEAVDSGPYKFEVPSDNGSEAHSTSFSLYQMDTEEFQFDEDYVIAREEFDAGGRDAVLLTFDSRTGYDKTAYVIFDDLQYVAEVSMGKGITTDEDGNMTAFMMDRYILTRRIAVPIQTGIISLQR